MTASDVAADIGDAILVKLAADIAPVTVGDGRAPDGQPDLYAIIDHMDGTISGDLDDGDTTVKAVVQIRSVGLDRPGAQYVQDRVRSSLLDRTLTVAGITLLNVDPELSGRIFVDNDAVPVPRQVAMDRIAFYFDTRGA